MSPIRKLLANPKTKLSMERPWGRTVTGESGMVSSWPAQDRRHGFLSPWDYMDTSDQGSWVCGLLAAAMVCRHAPYFLS